MKRFVIKDLFHDNEMELYLNKETTSVEDIWQSYWPKNVAKDERYIPKVFDNVKEAKRYLKEIRRKASIEWQENGHILKLYGKRKYDWDLYEYNDY